MVVVFAGSGNVTYTEIPVADILRNCTIHQMLTVSDADRLRTIAFQRKFQKTNFFLPHIQQKVGATVAADDFAVNAGMQRQSVDGPWMQLRLLAGGKGCVPGGIDPCGVVAETVAKNTLPCEALIQI